MTTARDTEIIAFTSTGGLGTVTAKAHAEHSFENTILQKLDDWIPDEKTGSFNPAKSFADNVETWEDCPVVYGEGGVHPDPRAFEEDPEKAMEAVRKKTGKRCEIVGSITNPRVEVEGQPRLMATLSFDDDEAYQLWEDGKLRVSTALFVREKDKQVIEVVRANHVLIFPSDAAGQGDKGALIMNTDGHKGDDMKQDKGEATGKGIVHTAWEKLVKAADELGQALRSDIKSADEAAKQHADAKDYCPRNPEGYGKAPENAEWMKPTLDDFTDKLWADLSDDERRGIASCYAYCGDLNDFSSLKLPHHDPKTKSVVWNGVRSAFAAAMGARGGVDLGTRYDEVISHLMQHYRDFDKKAPWGMGEMQNTAVGRDEMTNTEEIDKLKSKINSLELEAAKNSDAFKAKDAEIAALKDKEQVAVQQMNTMKADREKAEAELAKYKTAEADARFQAALNTLPKGLYHKEEDKAALRKLWDEDPRKFFLDLAPKMNTGKTSGEEGSEHDVKHAQDKSGESPKIGNYNPLTGKWE